MAILTLPKDAVKGKDDSGKKKWHLLEKNRDGVKQMKGTVCSRICWGGWKKKKISELKKEQICKKCLGAIGCK